MKSLNTIVSQNPANNSTATLPVSPPQPTQDASQPFTSLAFDFLTMDRLSFTAEFANMTAGQGTLAVQASDRIPPPNQNQTFWDPPPNSWFQAQGDSGPLSVTVTGNGAWNLSTAKFAPRWARLVWTPAGLNGGVTLIVCATGKGAH